jgi:SAM-dependent methyltransferase
VSDDTFGVEWLELREPVDHRSRAEELLDPLREHWENRRWSRVLDLGSGTGSNLRYLAPRLPGPQRWTLLDHDPSLLKQANRSSRSILSTAIRVQPVVGRLETEGLERAAHVELVTASALLDLVSEAWLQGLVSRCQSVSAGVLLALSYDGRIRWHGPPDPDDDWVRERVNEHQLRDKGTGAALGPRAGQVAVDHLRRAGYRCTLVPSPWSLGPADSTLIRRLLEGWVAAVGDLDPNDLPRAREWLERRTAALGRKGGDLEVGHLDLLALPPSPPFSGKAIQ